MRSRLRFALLASTSLGVACSSGPPEDIVTARPRPQSPPPLELGGGPDGGSGPPRKSQLLGACDGGLVDYGVGTLPAASAVSLVLRLPLPVPVSGPVAITWLWTGSFSGNGIDLSAPTTFLLLDPKEISLRYRAEQWTDFKLCVLARRADGLPFGGAQGWVGCPGLDAGFTGFANVPSLDFSGLPNGSCVEMTLLATPADGGIFR